MGFDLGVFRYLTVTEGLLEIEQLVQKTGADSLFMSTAKPPSLSPSGSGSPRYYSGLHIQLLDRPIHELPCLDRGSQGGGTTPIHRHKCNKESGGESDRGRCLPLVSPEVH